MIQEVVTIDNQHYYALPEQPDIYLPLDAALTEAELQRRIAACPRMAITDIHEEWGPLQDSPAYECVPDMVKQQIAAGALIYGYRQWCTFPNGEQYIYAMFTGPVSLEELPQWRERYRVWAVEAQQRAYIRAGCDQL